MADSKIPEEEEVVVPQIGLDEALQVKLIHKKAKLPTRGTPFSAGFDLYAVEETTLPAGGRKVFGMGIEVAIPDGYYGQIASRSSFAVKYKVDAKAGVIDSDYRGEVGVVLHNYGSEEFVVNVGDRIAQLILIKISTVPAFKVKELSSTFRGTGGYGSTGVS